jgi:hypothetical protein
MRHVLYALFSSRDDASAAIADLTNEGVSRERCKIVVEGGDDRQLRTSQLDLAQTDARKAVSLGVVLGAVLGGGFGAALAGPLHVTDMGVLPTAVFSAVAGSGIGALGGVLAGSMNPDRTLSELAPSAQHGKVMATVEVEGLTIEELVERIFRAHGAMQIRKSLI